MPKYSFNWRWTLEPKAHSKRVKPTPISTSARTFSLRGPNDATKFKSFQLETQRDIGSLASILNNVMLPLLDSFPAGGADARWSLRREIDCFSYGVQGSTLFVFNAANENLADGRYWHKKENRPYTIAEKIEDHDGRISWLETNSSSEVLSSTNIDLQSLWKAVGANYQDGNKESWSWSLDKRCESLECHDSQLAPDLYGNGRNTTGDYTNPSNAIPKYTGWNSLSGDPGWSGWSWSTSCAGVKEYGYAEYIQYLALLHGINPISSEKPWQMTHDGIPVSDVHRYEVISARTGIDEETRETTPIEVVHNLGHHPVINVLDNDPGDPSWARDAHVEYINDHQFNVYTGAEFTLIIYIG